MKAATNEPTWRARWLGRVIRELRDGRGLTVKEVGEYLRRSTSIVSNFETGINPIPGDELLKLLDLYGVSDFTQRADLQRLARDVTQRGWWDNYEPYINKNFTDYLWLEDNAHTINLFGLTALPGLLQTSDYMKILIENGPKRDDELQMERVVEARLMRQQVLSKAQLRFLVYEPVLLQAVGSAKVRAGQYDRLLQLVRSPNLELRILPTPTWKHIAAGMTAEFTHFILDEPLPEVVCVDSSAGSRFLEAPDIDSYTETYDALWTEDALDDHQSVERIRQLTKDVTK